MQGKYYFLLSCFDEIKRKATARMMLEPVVKMDMAFMFFWEG
jgi:hypothetical protein